MNEAGFNKIEIEKQGAFWSVLAYMMRSWLTANSGRVRWRQRLLRRACIWLRRKALTWDKGGDKEKNGSLAAFTTGFGVVAGK